jgi:hypothetical protein
MESVNVGEKILYCLPIEMIFEITSPNYIADLNSFAAHELILKTFVDKINSFLLKVELVYGVEGEITKRKIKITEK